MDRRDRRHQLIAGLMTRGQGPLEASRAGLVWGAILVAAGVALLLDHMGFIVIGSLFRFWPMVLVFFGVGHLFTPSNRAWGVILIVVGAILQLNNLGLTRLRFADMWPMAIIAVGLILMWGALKPPIVLKGIGGTNDTADFLEAIAIFAGTERRIRSQTFKGGRVTSIFGGVELDFRDANIDGDEATLEITCIFGGVEIRVPERWNVHFRSIPVLGGYSDKTRLSAAPSQDSTNEKRKTLIITGAVIFGGVEIGN